VTEQFVETFRAFGVGWMSVDDDIVSLWTELLYRGFQTITVVPFGEYELIGIINWLMPSFSPGITIPP